MTSTQETKLAKLKRILKMGSSINKLEGSSETQGYSCTFIETPSHDLRCIVCTRPARNPQQTACCGRLFCKFCLLEQKKESSQCPQCHDLLTCFDDRASDARIKRFTVRCTNEDSACKWQGKLRDLEDHIENCDFTKVPCTNGCGNSVIRCALEQHMEQECVNRDHKCIYCEETGSFGEIMAEHAEMCPNYPITCPNQGCGRVMMRQELEPHRSVCSCEIVSCSFASFGCNFKTKRGIQDEAMSMHQRETIGKHLDLAVVTLSSTQTPPRVFKMASVEEHQKENTWWYSPPFYSHRGGYRMCLAVLANGHEDGKGTHLSVYMNLMKGKHDRDLMWPFRGEIVIELLNQLRNRRHHSEKVQFQIQWVTEYNRRVEWGDRGTKPWGKDQFLPHEKLKQEKETSNCQYLRDDCLYFRVSSVRVDDTNKPWLMCTD